MDTSTDEKSEESTGMDCVIQEKLENAQLRLRSNTNLASVLPANMGDSIKIPTNAAPSK